MCYPKPGSRCSFHTKRALDAARQVWQHTKNPEDYHAFQEAFLKYHATPDGIEKLEKAFTNTERLKEITVALNKDEGEEITLPIPEHEIVGNTLLNANIHRGWQRQMVDQLSKRSGQNAIIKADQYVKLFRLKGEEYLTQANLFKNELQNVLQQLHNDPSDAHTEQAVRAYVALDEVEGRMKYNDLRIKDLKSFILTTEPTKKEPEPKSNKAATGGSKASPKRVYDTFKRFKQYHSYETPDGDLDVDTVAATKDVAEMFGITQDEAHRMVKEQAKLAREKDAKRKKKQSNERTKTSEKKRVHKRSKG